MTVGNESTTSPAVELREDIPLKSGGNYTINWTLGRYFGGIRFIILCFGILSAAITIALAAQIYYGHYELVQHGSVASDSDTCSKFGTDILKAGGNAVDSAITTAFCLAVVAPHETGLDSGGIFMLYNYKEDRADGPTVINFAEARNLTGQPASRYPRLISSLAFIHKNFGKLAWAGLVRPAAHVARNGFRTSANLAKAIRNYGSSSIYGLLQADQPITMTALANYLDKIANLSTTELAKEATIGSAKRTIVGDFEILTPEGSAGGDILVEVLQEVFKYNFTGTADKHDQVLFRIAESLKKKVADVTPFGSGSNIAIVASGDVYVSLVTGMTEPFGSHNLTPDGYLQDFSVSSELVLIPAIVTENYICGRRFVLGSNELSLLPQVIANLIINSESLISAIELPRITVLGPHALGIEGDRQPMFSDKFIRSLQTLGTVSNLSEPYASCNVIQQLGDALISHSDSRGGGIASRF